VCRNTKVCFGSIIVTCLGLVSELNLFVVYRSYLLQAAVKAGLFIVLFSERKIIMFCVSHPVLPASNPLDRFNQIW
jgi:hypothetical protein